MSGIRQIYVYPLFVAPPAAVGATTFNQFITFFEKLGPSSYPTGGFVIDLTAAYSSLNDFRLMVKKGSRGVLGATHLDIALNSPANGKVTVKVSKYRFDQASSIGGVQNQPAGVTVRGASGVVSTSEAAHTHTIDHNHAAATSSGPTTTGAGVNSALATLNKNVGSHTHIVDIPNLVGTSGAGSSHNHIDNNVYAHSHVDTYAATNLAVVELANATDLSATTWFALASGVRV